MKFFLSHMYIYFVFVYIFLSLGDNMENTDFLHYID